MLFAWPLTTTTRWLNSNGAGFKEERLRYLQELIYLMICRHRAANSDCFNLGFRPFSRKHTKPIGEFISTAGWACSRCQLKDSQAKKTTEQPTFIAKLHPFVVGIQWNCGIITQLRLIQSP